MSEETFTEADVSENDRLRARIVELEKALIEMLTAAGGAMVLWPPDLDGTVRMSRDGYAAISRATQMGHAVLSKDRP